MNLCPNLNNKQVKKEFDELISNFGEDAAYYIWNLTNGEGLLNDTFKDFMAMSNDREYSLLASAIEAKSIGDETFMKAPNGEQSNLDKIQWIQVRTPQFKDWFGDWENNPENASKVVDRNGEPAIVYRAGEINKDGTLKTRYKAYYFAVARGMAEQYAKLENVPIHEFFLKANSINAIRDSAVIIDSRGNKAPKRGLFEMPWTVEDVNIILEGNEAAFSSGEYLVSSPNQIKSATDNVGTFSRTDDDIRYREVPNSSFESLDTEIQENLLKKGWTAEKFDSISQEERDQAIKCIAF